VQTSSATSNFNRFNLIMIFFPFFTSIFTVSCGSLIKQAIADETMQGQAAIAYISKNMMGKFHEFGLIRVYLVLLF